MSNTGILVTTFKERFSVLLSERPESATELADKMHVSKQTISAWRLGERHPNKITTVAIANFFNVNIDWLYGYDVEKYAGAKEEYEVPKTKEARFVSIAMDKMSPEDRKKAMNVLKAMYGEFFNETEGKIG